MFHINLNFICLFLLLVGNITNIKAVNLNRKTYEISDSIFANPERGLQKYSITDANYYTNAGYSNLNKSELVSWRTGTDKVTVIFRYFLLDAYLEQEIPSIYLENIQNDFNIIRDAGLKCLARFSYSNEQSTSPQQPIKSILLKHIGQLGLILESNKDIILTHQAGFLGTWGEWYYTNSTEFGSDGSITSAQWDARKEIIDSMLASTPKEIPVQVRYPEIKKRMYGTTLLNETTAYQNSANARIGFFNDAFLNNWGDMGTFSVDSELENPVGTEDYVYLSNETKYVPMSGETNGVNAPRTNGDNALLEMDSSNWTSLNRDYYTANWNNWITSGHYDSILKGLGYRFVMKSSSFEVNNEKLSVTIQLENVGFARLFKKRGAYIILINNESSDEYKLKLSSDPRTWESEVSIDEILSLSSVPVGVYDCYLVLPDSDSLLAQRPEFSIRLANKDIWEETLGYNNLNQQITVTTTSIIQSSGNDNSEALFIQNYPNPFRESTEINFYSSKSSNVSVNIYTLSGKLVKVLIDNKVRSGWSKVTWVGTDEMNKKVTSGIYLLKIKADNKTNFRRLILAE